MYDLVTHKVKPPIRTVAAQVTFLEPHMEI